MWLSQPARPLTDFSFRDWQDRVPTTLLDLRSAAVAPQLVPSKARMARTRSGEAGKSHRCYVCGGANIPAVFKWMADIIKCSTRGIIRRRRPVILNGFRDVCKRSPLGQARALSSSRGGTPKTMLKLVQRPDTFNHTRMMMINPEGSTTLR